MRLVLSSSLEHKETTLEQWLSGKKTYLVAIAMVILAGLRQQDYIDEQTYRYGEWILLGGGLAALRAGIKKS